MSNPNADSPLGATPAEQFVNDAGLAQWRDVEM
jgi:hypothetical protein